MKRLADKLYSWASILDPATQQQAEATARMPFIFPHVALMPDAHLGKGATVGSVIPTVGAIMPAAVGVDIGCGMMAVRTQFTESEVRRNAEESELGLNVLRVMIEQAIPSSMGRYNEGLYNSHTRDRIRELEMMPGIEQANAVTAGKPVTHIAANQKGWQMQLGSLGSGNHFIEVTADELGRVWLFLHSGSRGVGNRLATHHIKVARDLMKAYHVKLENSDLAYIPEDVSEFGEYIEALKWAQMFARLNREEMMERLSDLFGQWMGSDVAVAQTIQCHHNYTVQEFHLGQRVWLSRKGAINASLGVAGLIPGSMGEASYIVSGKHNRMSLNSAPHGAGRLYSRSAAKREFTYEQMAERMKGIEWSGSSAFLDETPGAYKPIGQVMEDAGELVAVEHKLHQIVNVKGV